MRARAPEGRLVLVACLVAAMAVAMVSLGATAAPRPASQRGSGADVGYIPPSDPNFAGLAQFMALMGGSEEDTAELAALFKGPTVVEFIKPFGAPGEAEQRPEIDPDLVGAAGLQIPDIGALAAPGGPLAQGEGPLGQVFWGSPNPPTGTEWYLYAKDFKANGCEDLSGLREFGIVGLDSTPLNGGNPLGVDTGTTDNLFYGINTAYVLHHDPGNPYVALRYERGAPGANPEFTTTATQWIGICMGETVVGLIPEVEWDGISELRYFGFDVPVGGSGKLDFTDGSQMRFPGIEQDPETIDESLVEIEVGQEPPTPEPTAPPTAEPTLAPTDPPITPEPTVPATPPPPMTPPPPITPAPSVTPVIPPTDPVGAGLDPLLVALLLGLGLIGLAILLWILAARRGNDCDELGKLALAAEDECARARQAAEEARAKHEKAAEDLRAADAYEKAARRNADDAAARIEKTKARAGQKSDDYVEGEPHGRITGDDLDLQNDANAEAKAEADAAKADARQRWIDAGSPQGEGAAKLDDELSAIERAAQDKMAHNNDPKNLGELRKRAAAKAAADMAGLEADLAAAHKSLDEATAALRNASENESAARAAREAAEREAERICAEAAGARKLYDDCVKKNAGVPAAGAGGAGVITPPKDDEKKGGGKGDDDQVKVAGKDSPPDRPCKDGEEEWRPYGEPRSFTVREDGGKTRVIIWTDPEIKGYIDWLDESASKDARNSGEHHPSITSAEVDLIPKHLNDWLGGLGGSKGIAAPNMTLSFEIRRVSVTVQCKRRWVCENGAWTPRETKADTPVRRPLPPATLKEGPVTPSVQKVQGFLGRAKAIIDELKKDEEEAQKAGRCE